MFKKLGVAVVAIATVFSSFAFVGTAFDAAAQTMTAPTTFTRDLTVGATGADVSALQSILIAGGYLKIAAPTGYFGELTRSALAAWQLKVGISPAAGYFGKITRGYLAVNGGGSTGGSTGGSATCPPGFVCTPTGGSNNGGTVSGSEASLEDFDLKDEDDLEEGEEKVTVATAEFDVEDGDARLERVDFNFLADASNDEEDPWNTFDKAYLMMDGKVIASMDVDSEDDWSDEDEDGYRIRFSGLGNTVVQEDDTVELELAVDVASSVDGADTGAAEWTLFVADEGIRALDGSGVDQYTGDDSDEVTFTIDEAGDDEELSVRESDDNPDSMTLKVEDDQTSEWYSILKFELEAEEGDIEINEFPITVTVSTSTTNAINDAKLIIDGEEYDDYTVSSSTGLTAVYTFDLDDEDAVISADETVDASFEVEFKKLSGTLLAGTTVEAEITSGNVDAIDAEGAEDLSDDQLNGSADGEVMTLREQGISVEFVSSRNDADNNTPDTNTDDAGDFYIVFDVTAFEEDAYIPLTAGTSTVTTTGVTFRMEDSNNNAILLGTGGATTTSGLTRVSGGNQTGNYVRLSDGQTGRFEVLVNFDPTAGGLYRLQLLSVNFNDTAAPADTVQATLPEEDYQSRSNLQINN